MQAESNLSSASAPATGLDLPSAVKNLVFDLDGTLIDSVPGIAASLAVAFESIRRNMPAANVRSAIGPPIRIIARRIEPSLTDSELDHLEPVYRADYDTLGWQRTIVFDGVADTLRELHGRGIRMFILTNKPSIPTAGILAHFDLKPYFVDAYSRDSRSPAFASKAEMLASLIEHHQLTPGTTLMIGDTIEDQEAAHANHLSFLHVTYGYGTIESPVLRIDRFTNLATLLEPNPLTPPKKQS